jgi:hypothetical protein
MVVDQLGHGLDFDDDPLETGQVRLVSLLERAVR